MASGSILAWLIGFFLASQAAAQNACPAKHDDGEYQLVTSKTDRADANEVVPLIEGSVVSTEAITVRAMLFQSDREIVTDHTIKVSYPAKSVFGINWFADMPHLCAYHSVAFAPPMDSEERGYPVNCLEDHDGDGLYEIIRFYAYHSDPTNQGIAFAIPPVALGIREPSEVLYKLVRRLRVVSISGNQARVILEDGILIRKMSYTVQQDGSIESQVTYDTVPDWSFKPPHDETVLLKQGSRMLLGLPVKLSHSDDRWFAQVQGGFAPWLTVDQCGGSKISYRP